MSGLQENKVLVIAPLGQDAESIASTLALADIFAEACDTPTGCLERVSQGAGALLLTEEALELPGGTELLDSLRIQPAWSQLPVIILTSGGESRFMGLLDLAASAAGSVTLLERPMSAATLVRSVQVALTSRRRQYQVRDLLAERQRQHEELQKSEERYRTLFESIDEGFCTIEVLFDDNLKPVDYRFLAVNPSFERQTGIPDAVGRRMREIAPLHEEYWFSTYGQVALTGEPIRFQNLAAQLHRFYDVYAFRVGNPARRHVGVLFNDISVRKQAEAVLVRDKAELEQLVAERTARLQELVAELEHFSYSITHDMRAPLRAMIAFSEEVQAMDPVSEQEEQKRFLERISSAARRMDLLITDALNYSKAVRNELPLAPVDVGRLLRGMLDTYPEFQIARADIRLEPELPLVLGNEAALTQCFSNLLGNAVKFARPGELAQVQVRFEIRDGWVRLWVEDRGIGISRKMQSRVFDMFARGSSPQSGTGIGLALVRKVVDRMGGKVGVESEEGKGSRFWVELRKG